MHNAYTKLIYILYSFWVFLLALSTLFIQEFSKWCVCVHVSVCSYPARMRSKGLSNRFVRLLLLLSLSLSSLTRNWPDLEFEAPV